MYHTAVWRSAARRRNPSLKSIVAKHAAFAIAIVLERAKTKCGCGWILRNCSLLPLILLYVIWALPEFPLCDQIPSPWGSCCLVISE